MRRLTPPTLLLIALSLIAPATARAWNKSGHMVTGAMAYRELKAADAGKPPAARAVPKLVAILKRHPWYEDIWLPQIEALNDSDPDSHDLYLFMLAARWPDDARDDPDLHCELCHYVNFPFKPPGEPASVHTQPPKSENVVAAYKRNWGILNGTSSDAVKALALCWVFHLTGDMHQPLHTSALFTTRFPQGDRGGTAFFVRTTAGSQTLSLHKLWDGQVLGSERYQEVRNRADALLARADLKRSQLAELAEKNPDRWAGTESFNAAVRFGYLNGALKSGTEGSGTVLPPNYVSNAKPLAERRAVLASYRLADALDAKF
jgi:hypothetical protein